MKKIGSLLQKKEFSNNVPLDEKSIFYVFGKVIKQEYGNFGVENFKAQYLKNGKLFIKAENSVWASELWLNREVIVEKMNRELGSSEIKELSL
ncbi:MAG: hypothetical protein ACD_11C00116G0009 [uncultured bacterium]|nr:MAG: hypothetical protein ACD_11C00116G0009 [uncultured bacterium]HBR71247.1 hypothetical protein [Candidatus Moranbacteria bacterium]